MENQIVQLLVVMQRQVCLSHLLASSSSLVFKLKKSDVVFPSTVTSDAGKVTVETLAVFRPIRREWIVLVVWEFTLTFSLPFRDLESFSSRKPVHSTLFRSLRNELELFARTVFTFAGDSLFRSLYVVVSIFAPTEAETFGTNPGTLVVFLFAMISDLNETVIHRALFQWLLWQPDIQSSSSLFLRRKGRI